MTTLNTPDNVQILVPNSGVWGDTIKNYAANDTRRNDITVGIAYDNDIGTPGLESQRQIARLRGDMQAPGDTDSL